MKTRNIMTVSVLAVLLVFGLNLVAPVYGQTILIDFGNASSYRGVDTPSPDINGNYWTSVWSGAYYPDLVDIDGNATAIDFGFATPGGTDSYNGPAGVTSYPVTQEMIDATDIDAVALGNLGINEAAMDFYDTSTFEIQGLDPTKTYNLTFFGSHKYSDDATTVYSVYTDNTYSSVVDSVSLDVQQPGSLWLHNRDTVVTIIGLSPQAFNILYVKFIGSNGSLGYLNCMQIEEVSGIKASNPDPSDGATNVPLTTNLAWIEPSEYSPVKYVLRFRVSDSTDPNWVVVDPVVDLNLDDDPATTEAAVPIALDYDTTYDWKVTAFEPNDPVPIENEGLIWSFTTEASPPGPPKIMAHYMPWYQSYPYSGYWGWHWHMNYFNPPTTIASHYYPLFGPYDSSDPHVLASQALLMKFGGIDGMIADWYGIEDFWDYGRIRDATNNFIPYIKEAQLEFSVCYEDQTVGHMLDNGYFADRDEAVAHGVQVMEWLEDNYFTDSSYLKIDSRPVLLCFGPQFFTDSEWTSLFNDLDPKPHFFPLKYHFVSYPTRTGEFDWPSPGDGTEGVIPNLNAFYNRAVFYDWEHFIGGAFPRFHDIYAEAGVGSSYGYIDDEGSYGTYGTSTYSYTLERGLQSSADIVQIVTWNDYGEGTIIEPTEEDGYLYLEITQGLRKEYIDPNFSYVAEDLRLPVRLYTLRKENLGNPMVMSQLDTVEDYLFADDLSGAEKLLDQIECTESIAGDLDGNCMVNLDDLRVLVSAWLSTPGDSNWNPDYDISLPPDNVINLRDFAVYAENWLTGTP